MPQPQPKSKAPTTLTDLPHELLDHITSYLPTASSLANLGSASKTLHTFVEKDAWKTFARHRFPSLAPIDTGKECARTLTTLSRAWDRRALVAKYVEPREVTAFPGAKRVERWKKPRGQTIGFTPQLDVYEEIGPGWRDRKEILAFSAGAEICLRQTVRTNSQEDVRWTTYRPLSASEGRNDVTTLHLLRPDGPRDNHELITGTANGDLQLLRLPSTEQGGQDVGISYFTTQGLPVRCSDLLQIPGQRPLLAANLGDSRIALYRVESDKAKMGPSSELDIRPPLRADGHPSLNHRAWTTKFLSPRSLAVGLGPGEDALQVYHIADGGASKIPERKFKLMSDSGERAMLSSVYSIVPLPPATGSSGNGDVFLSGAYDGVVRLHDMRSARQAEQSYTDSADDSAIYSLLPRGQEKLVVGPSRHSLLKIFDLRLGAKCYDYVDVDPQSNASFVRNRPADTGFNVFLRAHDAQQTRGGASGHWRGAQRESSVYSLASPSAHSPYIYAGMENAVMSMAFTEVLDPHPDPVYFTRCAAQVTDRNKAARSKEVLNLSMYEQHTNLELNLQRSLVDTWRHGRSRDGESSWKDDRWVKPLGFHQPR